MVGLLTTISMYLVSQTGGHKEASVRDLLYVGGQMGLLQTLFLCIATIYLAYTYIASNSFSFLSFLANAMSIASICGIVCAVFVFYFVSQIKPDLAQVVLDYNLPLAETEEAQKQLRENIQQKYQPGNLMRFTFLESIIKGLFISLFTGGVFGLLNRQFSKRT